MSVKTVEWCDDHECIAKLCRWLHRSELTGAELVVADIIDDLNDRRGLKQEWQHITPEIQAEIFAVWVGIVKKGNNNADATP